MVFGAILPGISSGVFCVAFGIYEKLINSVLHFFRDIKKHSKFLFPILVGVFIGVLVFSNLLKIVFMNFRVPTSFAFMGLILGTLPIVVKQAMNVPDGKIVSHKLSANKNRPFWQFSFSHTMCLILALSFSIYMAVLEVGFAGPTPTVDFRYLIFVGFVMSAGIVIPRC